VLGVVNTMGSVGQPPAVLGGMIGSALVGTFLGILLAYAFAEPLAGLLEQKVDESGKELQCIKTTLLASMQGYAPQVADRVRPQGAVLDRAPELHRAREPREGQEVAMAATQELQPIIVKKSRRAATVTTAARGRSPTPTS
jgi:hypothetical protein